ncbi:hypothetical protein [Vibrio sp. Hal054]|uniref:hypothetical protein n=1 Tax=Vibrio sp. Hal054 TaxID=3035158 RepID=UPI00301B928B
MITFQFTSNLNALAFQAAITPEKLTHVCAVPLSESGLRIPKQVPLQCYDNALRVLMVNPHATDLRLCLGLQQSISEPMKIVEHCWIEFNGKWFDSSSELLDSRYMKYCSLTLHEVTTICRKYHWDYLPNIITIENALRSVGA